MNCSKYSKKLSLFVLNEIPQIEADEITEHLKECENCSKQVNELSALLHEMSNFKDIEPPEDFLEKLTKRAEKELWVSKGKVLYFVKYMKIASIAAIFIVSFMAFRQLEDFRSKQATGMAVRSEASTGAAYGNAGGNSNMNILNDTVAAKQSAPEVKSVPKEDTQSMVAYDKYSSGAAGYAYKPSATTNAPVVKPSSTPISKIASEKNNAETENIMIVATTDTVVTEPKLPEKRTIAEEDRNKKEQTAVTSFSGEITGTQEKENTDALSDCLAITHVQIKTKKIAAAQWIREQAQKISGVEIAATSLASVSSIQTTQESTYADKTITDDSIVASDNKIIVDVNKEKEEMFKNSISEHFGKENVIFEENNITADKVRFIIVFTE